jgi:hypothetical protein
MTGFIVSVFPFRNRVSSKEAFEGLELGEGKLSRPVLRGLGGRKAAWLLGSCEADYSSVSARSSQCSWICEVVAHADSRTVVKSPLGTHASPIPDYDLAPRRRTVPLAG